LAAGSMAPIAIGLSRPGNLGSIAHSYSTNIQDRKDRKVLPVSI
jgi:hypothetical protein